MGLSWSSFEMLVPEKTRTVPAGPGLYLLSDAGSQEIIYIGQSGNCAKRLLSHSRKSWDEKQVEFSFITLKKQFFPIISKNRKNDLIGNYFEHYQKAPEHQFTNSR